MNNKSILVADSGETSRMQMINLLRKRGYKTYQATDGAGAIRIARRVLPSLVILDTNIWGMGVYEVANILEMDRLSTVLLMTNSPNRVFYEQLKKMNIYAYITKPIQPEQVYHTVEFSIMNANKISSLIKKVEKLENTLEGRKMVDRAKGILMEQLGLTESDAYQLMRRKSMDQCKSIEKIAEEIIRKENN